MTNDLNLDNGKIAGKSSTSTEPFGKIAGKSSDELPEINKNDLIEKREEIKITSRKDRIGKVTADKGLKSLPPNFGDSDGDWQVIESENLFEVLYLDHNQIISITPEMVKNNFTIIEKFWKEKKNLWESGSGQVRKTIEDKYGEKNLNNCIKRLENAFAQLSSIEKITIYHNKLEKRRIDLGKNTLLKEFDKLTRDENMSETDFQILFEMENEIDLSEKEISSILLEFLTNKKFIAVKWEKGKGWVQVSENFGGNNYEKISSFAWLSENKIKNQPPPIAIEILLGQFAESLEEIGKILFDDEENARQLIRKRILHNSVGVFSQPRALIISDICESKETEYLKYLRTIYKLNSKLPFRFQKKEYSDILSLTLAFFEEEKQGKENFKQGTVEIWLHETNPEAYQKFIKIRDSAENSDLAFLEFLYTFNPKLPYRFAGNILVNSPQELCDQINKSKDGWEAGIIELYNSSITTWLKTIRNNVITDKWDQIKANYKKNDGVGLEEFCHFLNAKLEYPKVKVDKPSISFPKIQSGTIVKTEFVFTNETRGYMDGKFAFSKELEGVTLSAKKLSFNGAEGNNKSTLTLTVDSTNLLKGVGYETVIQLETSTGQKINIPVSFKVVFPKNAFIIEIAKSAAILSTVFVLARYVLSIQKPGWMNFSNKFFLSWDSAIDHYKDFSIFGWSFLLLFGITVIGGIILFKYLVSKNILSKKESNKKT